ncbi:MFS family permease [Litorivivens lipolytica]|uniref:MFS family permease n=1 Tax=Litorivivens lipolytica TaxID=1524264 RepID=A0A7W4Z5F8_9GAMM|nr:MFS transporter [Litorivivens lipolytica]MBB3047464.1 MFS family permease [Litorivivens lipolytica]
MTHPDRMTGIEKRAVFSLSLLYIFRMLGLFLVLPVLAVYGPDYAGSTGTLVGLAVGIYGLSQAVLQIPLGLLSDRFGRKPIIFAGLLLFALGSIVAASADTIWGLIAGRFLQGAGAIASTLTALMADLTREQHRSKAMAGIGASIGMSFAVALVLGPVISAQMGLSGLFWLTGVLALIGMILLWTTVPTATCVSNNAEVRSVPDMMRRCLADADLMRLNAGVFALHLMITAQFVAVPAYLESMGLDVARHWQIYLPMLFLAFLIMVPAMVAAERRGKVKAMILIAVALLGGSTLSMALLGHSLVLFLAGLLVFFVVFNLLEANLPSLLSRTVYPGGRGTAMGIFSSFQFFGAFCGGSLGGLLMANWGVTGVFGLCAGVGLVWLLIALKLRVPAPAPNLAVEIGRDEQQRKTVLERLREWPDVLDITVIAGEPVIYIKVASDFDRRRLDELISA